MTNRNALQALADALEAQGQALIEQAAGLRAMAVHPVVTPSLWSVEDAAATFGVHRSTLYRLMNRGELAP